MSRAVVFSLLLFLSAASAWGSCDPTPEQVRQERVTGSLSTAEKMARQALACPDLSKATELELRIELFRVLHRIGLHQNTRPVAEALRVLEEAEASLAADDRTARAHLDLALADYYYSAEIGERKFPNTKRYAERAHQAFAKLADTEALTDATHRIGMIAFQQRDLETAREWIEESLSISKKSPERPIFVSDYHRHIGFVFYLSEDLETAISHFRESLKHRLRANSRDYSLFAYNMLGQALVEAGRPEEAREHLEQALHISDELPSPVGQLRATLNLGSMHEALEDSESALRTFRKALELAQDLGSERSSQSAAEAIARLESQSTE